MNQAMQRPWQRRLRVMEIRDIALAQLFHPRPEFDRDRYTKELVSLAPVPQDQMAADFLEADILLKLGAGGRPRRAQKSLYRLYKAQVAANGLPAFETFAALLREIETRGHSLEGLYFPQAFLSMNHDSIWADVRKVLGEVSAVIGPLFLNSGTLLGVVRDKSFIAHDDDVDLAVILEAEGAESAARAWQEARIKLDQAGLLAVRQGPNPGAAKLISGGVYNIDLFPGWIEQGRVYVYPHTCGDLPDTALLPLATCDVTDLPIPADAEAMLAVNYGRGWREPDPGYAFPWTRANRRFAAFLTALETDGADMHDDD